MSPFLRSRAGAGGLALALLLGPFTAATDQAMPPALPRLHIGTGGGAVSLRVEIAATPSARARGLMGRAALATDAGMLFVYPQAQDPARGFWMYRTRIPLDIAFLDADGRILLVLGMEPCRRLSWRCPRYTPGVAYWAALEVNRGFFTRHGIGVGDRVVLPDGMGQVR